MSVATGDTAFNDAAVKIMRQAHAAFVRGTPAGKRTVWKMDVHLQRPLVASEGNLDALDALSVYLLLQQREPPEPEQARRASLWTRPQTQLPPGSFPAPRA
jgi:hypothetical protein